MTARPFLGSFFYDFSGYRHAKAKILPVLESAQLAGSFDTHGHGHDHDHDYDNSNDHDHDLDHDHDHDKSNDHNHNLDHDHDHLAD